MCPLVAAAATAATSAPATATGRGERGGGIKKMLESFLAAVLLSASVRDALSPVCGIFWRRFETVGF